MNSTDPTALLALRNRIEIVALARALGAYRARTIRTISTLTDGPGAVSGRHVFHVREIISLCGSIATNQATEIMPALDLDSVTCAPCLLELTKRVSAS